MKNDPFPWKCVYIRHELPLKIWQITLFLPFPHNLYIFFCIYHTPRWFMLFMHICVSTLRHTVLVLRVDSPSNRNIPRNTKSTKNLKIHKNTKTWYITYITTYCTSPKVQLLNTSINIKYLQKIEVIVKSFCRLVFVAQLSFWKQKIGLSMLLNGG